MKNEDFILKMREIANNEFGTIDYVIYDNIQKHSEEIVDMKLDEFAKFCYTSKPSILKFCHKIGLEGYSELKYLIKNIAKLKENVNQELSVVKEYTEADKFRLKYANLSRVYIDLLLENYDKARETIKTLVDKINNGDVIYIFCTNLAYYAAKNFVQKMTWLNKHVILENDINIIESYISQMSNNSVTIIISLSGLNPYMLQVANWLDDKKYSFALTGEEGKLIQQVNGYCLIPQNETELWDNFSLRAKFISNFFDFLFIEIEKGCSRNK